MSDDRCDLLCLDLPLAERLRAGLDRDAAERAAGARQGARRPDAADGRDGAARRRRAVRLRPGLGRSSAPRTSSPITSASCARAGLVRSRRDGKMVMYALTESRRGAAARARARAQVPRVTELPMLPMAPAGGAGARAAARRRRRSATGSTAWTARSCARTVEKAVAALDGVARRARVLRQRDAGRRGTGRRPSASGGRSPPRAIARARLGAARVRPPAPFWRRDPAALSTTLSVVRRWPWPRWPSARRRAARGRRARSTCCRWRSAAGRSPARRSLALRRRSLDMNVLMALAAVGAVGIGAYAEGAWVLVLFAVGTTLETLRARPQPPVGRGADGARAGAGARARRRRPSALVPVEEVAAGTRFAVRPGERVPLDGVVVGGASSVDEAPITGESVPVRQGAGRRGLRRHAQRATAR